MLKKLVPYRRILLGLSWEEDGVRIVEVGPGRQKYHVKASFFPFPEPVLETGCQVNHHAMVEFMKRMVIDNRWHKPPVVTALPAHQVLIRHLKLPPMPKEDLHKAITWEISQILGRELSEYTFDYMVTGVHSHDAESEEINVLIAAVSRAKVEEYYSLFSKAGFRLQAIDVIPAALKRALVQDNQLYQEGSAVVLLDLGNCCSQLTVIDKGQLTFTRSLPYPLPKFAPNKIQQNSDAKSKPSRLVQEIKKTLDFFQAENRRPVAEIIVSGVACSPAELQFLNQDIGIRMFPGIPGSGLKLDWHPDPSYAVAMGLALKGVRD